MHELPFQPFPGLGSSHLQMIVASYLPVGNPPPSKEWKVDLGNGDSLSCLVSTPGDFQKKDQTVVLIHGMGGCASSNYMIRLAQKLYAKGIKVVRVNLRGCGSGKGLSKLLYNAGTSQDIFKVIQGLKRIDPHSEIGLIGFSLGGNIVLKLAGELGENAPEFIKTFIAVSPPIDLEQTVMRIMEKRNYLYHLYYLKKIKEQASVKNPDQIRTLYEFDDLITAPPWGYQNASAYYQHCSSKRFLPKIRQSTQILLAKDDPFIPLEGFEKLLLPKITQEMVKVNVTAQGGHVGFLGKPSNGEGFYWMDDLLLNWIEK